MGAGPGGSDCARDVSSRVFKPGLGASGCSREAPVSGGSWTGTREQRPPCPSCPAAPSSPSSRASDPARPRPAASGLPRGSVRGLRAGSLASGSGSVRDARLPTRETGDYEAALPSLGVLQGPSEMTLVCRLSSPSAVRRCNLLGGN